MSPVTRYFTETETGEEVDGPFKSLKLANAAAELHFRKYKYRPLVKDRVMDADTFMKTKPLNERLY